MSQPSLFTHRLNRLFLAIRPPGRGEYTNVEVVEALRRRGVRISGPYLSQLRRGLRIHPSAKVIEALADFFGVETAYLTGSNTWYCSELDAELAWLVAMHDEHVRELTVLLLQMPPDEREELLDGASPVDGGIRLT